MAKESKALTVISDEDRALLQNLGGGAELGGVYFPSFKLQHTMDFNGDPNELRGHFTITEKDELGNWNTQDLGETVELQFLIRRYRLYLKKGDTTYSSREFDSQLDQINLTQQTGEGDNQKFVLHSTGTVKELQQQFLVQNDEGKVSSELKLLSVLYAKHGETLVKWKMNMSATMAYSRYAKSVMPFEVVTKMTVEEKKNGAVKIYSPIMVADRKISDVQDAIQTQKGLRGVFAAQGGYSAPKEEETTLQELPEPQTEGIDSIPF